MEKCNNCQGSGIDPAFLDKCTVCAPNSTEEKEVKLITEKQAAYIGGLTRNIGKIIRVDLGWASNSVTSAEASEIISLLINIEDFVKTVKVKKDALTPEQIEKIRTEISSRPASKWLNAAKKKISTI